MPIPIVNIATPNEIFRGPFNAFEKRNMSCVYRDGVHNNVLNKDYFGN